MRSLLIGLTVAPGVLAAGLAAESSAWRGSAGAGPVRAAAVAPAIGIVPRVRAEPCVAPTVESQPSDLAARLEAVKREIQAGRTAESADAKKCRFRAAEEAALRLVDAWPKEAEAHYLLAVSLGLRADNESGTTAVQFSSRAYQAATTVLSLDPEHPGAHHILGRVHAAVMRLSGFRRFVAVNLLGGRALSGASWESAERHLARAETGAPDVLEHHYELGVLFVDRGRRDEARREFEHVLQIAATDDGDRQIHERAVAELERLDSGTRASE